MGQRLKSKTRSPSFPLPTTSLHHAQQYHADVGVAAATDSEGIEQNAGRLRPGQRALLEAVLTTVGVSYLESRPTMPGCTHRVES